MYIIILLSSHKSKFFKRIIEWLVASTLLETCNKYKIAAYLLYFMHSKKVPGKDVVCHCGHVIRRDSRGVLSTVM